MFLSSPKCQSFIIELLIHSASVDYVDLRYVGASFT